MCAHGVCFESAYKWRRVVADGLTSDDADVHYVVSNNYCSGAENCQNMMQNCLYKFFSRFLVRVANINKSRAVAGMTARCRCKFRYLSKFTAASRGFQLFTAIARFRIK